jgi:hypothetical protein
MTTLDQLKPGVKVKGIIPDQVVTTVDAQWRGSTAIELIYKREDGQPGTQLLYQNEAANLDIVQTERRCLICAPGNLAGQWQDELWFKFQNCQIII